MTKTDDNRIKMGGLAKKFIVYILLFSSLITLLGTSLQLYLDYDHEIFTIVTALGQIEKSHKQTVINNLWVSDTEQLQVQLRGILDLPSIEYLSITQNNETIIALGEGPSDRVISRSYPLRYTFRGKDIDLGVLHAYANLDVVYNRLFNKVFVILTTQAVKTFLVSFFIFLLFYFLIGKHLEKLSHYAKGLNLRNLGDSISLQRKKKNNSSPDELDSVVHAINEMRANLTKDIDARIQAEKSLSLKEKALSEKEKLLNTIIDGTSDAIFLKDLQGRYILANEATAIAVGIPKEEIIGKTDNDLFPKESLKVINTVDSRVINSGLPFVTEERVQTTSGDTYWLANKCPLINEEGEIKGLIGISRDITEIKKAEKEKALLEEKLNQFQKLEAIGTLAGGIAHDFNNILGVILGYAEMAREDATPGTQITEDLDEVLIAANRAKQLVKQILAFSRQVQVERIPIKIQTLIKEGLKMLRFSIPTTISITENSDPESGIVLADPTQINQILMNLCTNAYQAMEETGGALSVTVKDIFIDQDDAKMLFSISPGEYVEMTVTDTGTGIGPDVIEKIFDPYFTTKEIGKGTGMGLSIIYGIMQDYGGTITVESQLGKGTTFHVYFPVAKENALPEIKEHEDLPRGKERVLFIDDEEILADMGKKMLERLGYHVTVRRSSLEALSTFQNTPNEFDIVITDQTMPDMTGADLARRMMQRRPDVPIILCTGYSNLIDESSAKAIGIKEFALKPLTKTLIAQLIRKVLDNNQP